MQVEGQLRGELGPRFVGNLEPKPSPQADHRVVVAQRRTEQPLHA